MENWNEHMPISCLEKFLWLQLKLLYLCRNLWFDISYYMGHNLINSWLSICTGLLQFWIQSLEVWAKLEMFWKLLLDLCERKSSRWRGYKKWDMKLIFSCWPRLTLESRAKGLSKWSFKNKNPFSFLINSYIESSNVWPLWPSWKSKQVLSLSYQSCRKLGSTQTVRSTGLFGLFCFHK